MILRGRLEWISGGAYLDAFTYGIGAVITSFSNELFN